MATHMLMAAHLVADKKFLGVWHVTAGDGRLIIIALGIGALAVIGRVVGGGRRRH